MTTTDTTIRLKTRLHRLLKVTLVVFGALLLLFVVYFIVALRGCYRETACPSSDPKIMALYEVNNRLNKAFARHDWKYIWGQLREGHHKILGDKFRESGLSYQSFYNELLDAGTVLGSYDVQMISYSLKGDTAWTSNHLKGWLIIPPFRAFSDSMSHRWTFCETRWMLSDWFITIEPQFELSPQLRELLMKAPGNKADSS